MMSQFNLIRYRQGCTKCTSLVVICQVVAIGTNRKQGEAVGFQIRHLKRLRFNNNNSFKNVKSFFPLWDVLGCSFKNFLLQLRTLTNIVIKVNRSNKIEYITTKQLISKTSQPKEQKFEQLEGGDYLDYRKVISCICSPLFRIFLRIYMSLRFSFFHFADDKFNVKESISGNCIFRIFLTFLFFL